MTWSRVVALSGGVGGARFLDGLARALPPGDLTAIVNTGDDFVHLGLYICPDLDTVMYTLAGVADEERGWGLSGETFAAMEKDSAADRRSMKEFQRLLDLYRDFLEAADRYRLAGKPDSSLRYAALIKAVRIKPQAVLVLGALGAESSGR